MAIDKETGKRIPIVKKEKKIPKYEEDYENALRQQLFEESKKKDDDDIGFYEEVRELHHHKRDGEWDVPIDEEIRYFDPELSYELTGFRPINMESGLDFDPMPFTEMARIYESKGVYTDFPEGTKPYKEFWKEQMKRCVEGYTVGKYRITGDHYFFLNFYRMQTAIQGSTKAVTGRSESFPSFLAKQYEFFHYVEMCEYLGMDVCMLKARGLGFSEILACLGVRPFTTTREFRTVYTADSEGHLNPTLTKVWKQLNWLNTNTQGGMKHLRQKIDNMFRKRASMINAQGDEYGPMAEIEGIVADNPTKVRGDRTERLIFEEAGSNKNMITSWVQGDALVNLGGVKVGVKISGGTGGDSGPALAGLAKMFNDPMSYNILPYKHFHTRDGSVQYSGFFIPAHEFSLRKEYLDNRGVTNSVEFKKFYEKKRAGMKGQDAITYAAENCFTPDEALLKQGDNLFDAELLSEQLTRIATIRDLPKPIPMGLTWDRSGDKAHSRVNAHKMHDSPLLVLEEPLRDQDGNVYKNLYVAGIDGIDQGQNDSASTYDVSDFCIVIKKRVFGMNSPQYVAIYKERPKNVKTAYDMAFKLLVWYNAQAMLEYTKMGFAKFLEAEHRTDLLMSRPEFATAGRSVVRRQQKRLIGIPSTTAVIEHGLELITVYLSEYWQDIYFEELLYQLLNYSFEDKRKFDIVAALVCVEIGDEALMNFTPKRDALIQKEWKDFGWYTDSNGYRRFGVIPIKKW